MSRMDDMIRESNALNKGSLDNVELLLSKEDMVQHIPQTPQEINDFFANNEWIIYAVIRPYRGLLEYEDLFQEACIGAVKGINTFDPGKGTKLTSYVYTCAKNEVKMAVRKGNAKKRSANVVSIDHTFLEHIMKNPKPLTIPDSNTDVEKDALERVLYCKIMEVVRTKLTTIEQIVVIQYKDGVPQSKTGKYLHISQGQVSKILNQALCKIKYEVGLTNTAAGQPTP